MNNTQLLIIDPQFDFCNKEKGSLYVQGADQDMERLASMISRLENKFSKIHVSADHHCLFSIFFSGWWRNSLGHNPPPFTMISVEDVENKVWVPVVPLLYDRSLRYVKALKAGGKYSLVIWPVHCRALTEGATIDQKLMGAISEWENNANVLNVITKGSSPYTENYSVFRAEVEDSNDPTTHLNTELLETLTDADEIVIAGEALSHCVASSVYDLIFELGDNLAKKLVFLTDASSSVTGFEHLGEKFLKDMVSKGMRLSTTKEYS